MKTFHRFFLFLALTFLVAFHPRATAQTIYRLDANDVLDTSFWTTANRSALDTAFGPSLKSTLNARAPRQGLIFDGSAGATGTLGSAIETSAFTIDLLAQIPASLSANAGLIHIGTAATWTVGRDFGVYLNQSDGKLKTVLVGATGADAVVETTDDNIVATYGGKTVRITITRDGTTFALKINGVAVATTNGTSGTSPTWAGTLNGTVVTLGKLGNVLPYPSGYLAPLIYNRALSASEITALFESGTVAAADFNSASNTAINTDACTNSSFTSFTGASAAGFTAVKASGTGTAIINPSSVAVTPGAKFRLTGTLTLNNGKLVIPAARFGGSASDTVSLGAAGAFSIVLTGSANTTNAVLIDATGDSDFTISGLSVTRLGTLLALDPSQPGSGTTAYDISGNGANVTWTTGVSWAVPAAATTQFNSLVVGTGSITQEALLHLSKSTYQGEGAYLYIDNPANSGSGNKAGIKFATSVGGSFASVPTGEITNVITDAGSGASAIDFGTFNGVSSGRRARLTASGGLNLGGTTDLGEGSLSMTGNLTVSGTGAQSLGGTGATVAIAGTSAIKGVRTATFTHDFGTLPGNDSDTFSVAISGIAQGDTVIANFTDGDIEPNGTDLKCVAQANVVYVRLVNTTGSSIVVGSKTGRVTVISF